MRVRDVMTSDPVTVPPSSSMLAAPRLLARHGIRHLPVVDDDRLVGVVSDRDLDLTDRRVRRALAELGSDLVSGRFRLVQDVMSVPVHTVASDAPLGAAAALLRQHRIGALPVVDEERLVGVVTRTDCLRVLERDTADAPPPVVDPVTASTHLVGPYRIWRPGVAVRIADAPPVGSGGSW